jgi:hypothetical protein
MKGHGGSFSIRDSKRDLEQEPVLIHPAQLFDNAAHSRIFSLTASVSSTRIALDHIAIAAPDLEKFRRLFEYFGLKPGLLQCKSCCQAADAATDDRDLDHSAESSTEFTRFQDEHVNPEKCLST